MEHGGVPRQAGDTCLLEVVDPNSWDWDEDDLVGGIKPKSSPLPRRKSSSSSDDSDLGPPPTQSRRVSFADAFGLNLVSVKEFDAWVVPTPSAFDPIEGEAQAQEEYSLSCLFTLPNSETELAKILWEQKVELESVELLPGSTTLRGLVQVLNLCFHKTVYVRTTLDSWTSHFDLLAEFVPGSSNGQTDRFSFRLTLVPPFEREGARVEFCLRYETPVGTFWANNRGMNYVLFCKKKEETMDRLQQTDVPDRPKRSCLKAVSKEPPSDACPPTLFAAIQDEPKDNKVLAAKEMLEIQLSEVIQDDEDQQTKVDNNLNCRRRSQRRAARLAQIREYFAQREMLAAGENKDIAAETSGKELTLLCETTPPLPPEREDERTAVLELGAGDIWNGSVNKQQEDASPDVPQGEILKLAGSGPWEALTCAKGIDTMSSAVTCEVPESLGHHLGSGVQCGGTSQMRLVSNPDVFCQPIRCSSWANQVPLGDQSDEGPPELRTSNVQQVREWGTNTRSDISSDTNRELCTQDSRITSDNTAKTTLPSDSNIYSIDPPFTFETFVAPLYQQAFCRVETENLDFGEDEEEEGEGSEEMEDESQLCITQTNALSIDHHCGHLTDSDKEGPTDMLAFPVYEPEDQNATGQSLSVDRYSGGNTEDTFANNADELIENSLEVKVDVDESADESAAGVFKTCQEPKNTSDRPLSNSIALVEQNKEHIGEEKENKEPKDIKNKVKGEEKHKEREKEVPRLQSLVLIHVEGIINTQKEFLTAIEVALKEDKEKSFLEEAEGEKETSVDKESHGKEKSLMNDQEKRERNEITESGDVGVDVSLKREDLEEGDREVYGEKEDRVHEEGKEREGVFMEEACQLYETAEVFCREDEDVEEDAEEEPKIYQYIPKENGKESDRDMLQEKEVNFHIERETTCSIKEEYAYKSDYIFFGGDEHANNKEYLNKDNEGREDIFRLNDIHVHERKSRERHKVEGIANEMVHKNEEMSMDEGAMLRDKVNIHVGEMLCREEQQDTKKREGLMRGNGENIIAGMDDLGREMEEEEEEEDGSSPDSLSDDEMEQHLLRVKTLHNTSHVVTGHQKDMLLSAGQRPSISRGRLSLMALSSISESLNEECDTEEEEREGSSLRKPGRSKEGSYYYDFFACFALYLFSVYWLCCHGEKDRLKGADRIQ
ncbi:uncharacterized protein LOC108920813 [Scleropages formosus]|uniref:uncharacterized protein LOC108920813 n=1 Tax=Scleropages formosus TaxID=113540 RepID=UPI0010FAAD96|nr:protein phosphatase 1 regulatory subunit 3A [Scleropages formosus]